MVAKYSGKVDLKIENLGESKLAERFGVKAYPALFVDDILVAAPQDFGYFGGDKTGRYAPWREGAGREKFKNDLERMLDLALAGKEEELGRERAQAQPAAPVSSLPEFALTDLSGKNLSSADLRGRIVIVEFWATWCPPCRSTLDWLGELQKTYGDRIAVLALAVDSSQEDVRKLTHRLNRDLHWAMATPKVAVQFGDVVSIPTLLLFDDQGNAAGTWYGAAPNLHTEVQNQLEVLSPGVSTENRPDSQ